MPDNNDNTRFDLFILSSPLRNRKSRVGICIGEEATTMAKREISSTLRNLKFMQRSAAKEEKKIDEEPNGSFSSLGSVVAKKCVVITDWDPQPGALLGRMSFQSFNPSVEKLNEEATSGPETDASVPTSSSSNGGRMSFSEPKVEPSREINGDLKRKQSEEQNHPSKSPKSSDKPSPSNKKGGDGFKKPKGRNTAWNVLKQLKQPQTKKGLN